MNHIFENKKIQTNILKHISNTSINNILIKVLSLDFPALEQIEGFLVRIRKKIYLIFFFYSFRMQERR